MIGEQKSNNNSSFEFEETKFYNESVNIDYIDAEYNLQEDNDDDEKIKRDGSLVFKQLINQSEDNDNNYYNQQQQEQMEQDTLIKYQKCCMDNETFQINEQENQSSSNQTYSDSYYQTESQTETQTEEQCFQAFDYPENRTEITIENNKNLTKFYVRKNQSTKRNFGQNSQIQERKQGKKNYEKNLCRNISKWLISAIIECSQYNSYSEDFEVIYKLCNEDDETMKDLKKYFYLNQEQNSKFLNGPRFIKDFLLRSKGEENKFAQIFRQYAIWYLKHKALRVILNNMALKEKQRYVNYKNTYMLKLLKNPASWPFNKNNQ